MKRCVYCLLVLALTLSVLPAMPALAEAGEEVTLTIGKAFNTQGTTFPEGHDAQNYNYYLDYAQQKANVKIEYSWFLADDSQKVTLAVASGNMPDVMLVDQTTYNMLLESDMLQSLSQVYETSGKGTLVDEVYSVYPESFQSAKVGDELMALPNAVAQYEHDVLWVRQDWLDKLGLEAPSNLEELEEVARAFIEQDPDGNGEADTIGIGLNQEVFTPYNGNNCAGPIAAFYGAYPRMWYQKEDGSVIYGSVDAGTRSALEYLARLYKEGIIDQEFAVRDLGEQLISGKCGLSYGRWAYATNELQQSHAFDGADWTPVLCPVDEEGNFHTRYRPPASQYVVVSKECAHPEKVIELINAEYAFHWYDDLDEEWTKKRQEYEEAGVPWGCMPIAVQLERTSIVEERAQAFDQYLTTGERTGLSTAVQGFLDSYDEYQKDPTKLTGWSWYKGMYQCGMLATSDKNTFVSPVFWGTTETMEDVWTTLETMEIETFVKIVMGEAPIEEFDRFVEQWNALGGEQVTSEVQALVDERG